jgi:lactoylglutathione lyase
VDQSLPSIRLPSVSKTLTTDTLTRLEQHGVTYVSVAGQAKDITVRADGIRQIYFQDPDGHWIEINDANAEP